MARISEPFRFRYTGKQKANESWGFLIDFGEQLAELRKRIRRIDKKYAREKTDPNSRSPQGRGTARAFIEEWASGEVVENEQGTHFRMERLYESHRRHGSADVGALVELPANLLDVLSESTMPIVSPERWAFLDTETTGLAGGSGTYAFLIGVGRITKQGFSIRQFFMREYSEEKSVLWAVSEHLNEFDVLITYNGKAYDQPLLETRYQMTRQKTPFGRLAHLDLLYGARRIWKLRYENCRLSFLENQVLGVERQGDLPGELIPYVYFEYLRSGEARRLVPIFHHNAIDILTLGCLSAIVPSAFRSSDPESLRALGLRRGEEYLGIARWFLSAGETEKALYLFRCAIEAGLPDSLLFSTLWELARLERKAGRAFSSLSILSDLATSKNPYRADALLELAKHYERLEPNYGLALEFARQAMDLAPTEAIKRRVLRLEAKMTLVCNRPLRQRVGKRRKNQIENN
ncbi:MAG: ribonuclease H-like domain-containing protein [Bryobacteraceae bacterium]